ncbi:MAG: hypothetical protein ACK5E4_15355 [Planctomycetia bacterium]
MKSQKDWNQNPFQLIADYCKMDNYQRWEKMVQYVAYLHKEPDNTNREA